jgi:integrase/recombinase XerD
MENKLVVSPDMEPSLWARYLNAYTALIKEGGYSPASVRVHVQLLERFSKWLSKGRTNICALDETVVKRFLLRLQSANSVRRGDAATLYRFLHMLRSQGVTRPARKSPLSPRQRFITNYGRYLLEERGLSKAAVVNYVPFVDQFLSARFQQVPLNLFQIRASDLTSFIRRQARKLSPGRAQLLATALRHSPEFGIVAKRMLADPPTDAELHGRGPYDIAHYRLAPIRSAPPSIRTGEDPILR